MADTETIYRVLKVPESLLAAMREQRDKTQTTNVQFLAAAVDDHLPRLISDLQRLGFISRGETRQAARLPFSDDDATLGRLRDASESVGLPATKLLELCLVAAVRNFHTATGPPLADKPCFLPGDQQAAEKLAEQLLAVKSTIDTTDGGVLLQRAAMAIEELGEWLRAHAGGDLVGAADAWADRAYVLFGDAVASGLPADELFAEVHRSNMSKDLVADGTGKATKGANYQPPNLVSILEAADHDR